MQWGRQLTKDQSTKTNTGSLTILQLKQHEIRLVPRGSIATSVGKKAHRHPCSCAQASRYTLCPEGLLPEQQFTTPVFPKLLSLEQLKWAPFSLLSGFSVKSTNCHFLEIGQRSCLYYIILVDLYRLLLGWDAGQW